MNSRCQLMNLSFDVLETQLKGVFDRPTYTSDATDHLLTLQQGSRSVADYSVAFWTLAVEAGWNEPPLMGVFRWRLNRRLWDTLALQARPKDLDGLITLATDLDNYMREQRCESAGGFLPTPSPSVRLPFPQSNPQSLCC